MNNDRIFIIRRWNKMWNGYWGITYLVDNGYLRKPKVIMGTSSGSIIGLCLTLGYKIEKIKDI